MKNHGFTDPPVFKVLNPLGEQKETVRYPLAERLSNLDGKTVYCISQVIMGSEDFIARVGSSLPDALPKATIVALRKPSAYMTDDPEFWDEVADKADALIYGCGV
jgi:hypothetical protein